MSKQWMVLLGHMQRPKNSIQGWRWQLSGITTASLTSALVELGTLVFSVEPHEPTLEDVFLVSTEEEE